MVYLLKMVIFHGYVSLPEGMLSDFACGVGTCWNSVVAIVTANHGVKGVHSTGFERGCHFKSTSPVSKNASHLA